MSDAQHMDDSLEFSWREVNVFCLGKYKLENCGPFNFGMDGEEGIYFDDESAVRLLNAAPDLLAACKAMCDTHGTHGPCEQNDCRSCDRAYEQARAAIAKAKPEGGGK